MLGKKAGKLMKDVDPKLSKSGNDKYLYDPDLTTVNPDYEKCVSDAACDERFEDKKRINMLKFSARKALRLAFHDCVGYADDPQGSGCDGCLNFDENRYETSIASILILVFIVELFLGWKTKASNTLQQSWSDCTLMSTTPKCPKKLQN